MLEGKMQNMHNPNNWYGACQETCLECRCKTKEACKRTIIVNMHVYGQEIDRFLLSVDTIERFLNGSLSRTMIKFK